MLHSVYRIEYQINRLNFGLKLGGYEYLVTLNKLTEVFQYVIDLLLPDSRVDADEESIIHTEGAMKEADAWRERISEIKKGIQNWADLEADAWETIKKSIR